LQNPFQFQSVQQLPMQFPMQAGFANGQVYQMTTPQYPMMDMQPRLAHDFSKADLARLLLNMIAKEQDLEA
jgi:hypothetical protein